MKTDNKKNTKHITTKKSSKIKSQQHTKSKSKTRKHKSQSIRSVKSVSPQPIVFGRIYADWCGHCKSMENDWTRLCSIVGNKIECVNIESKTQDTDIPSFNQKYNTNLALDSGYPTIFRLHKVGQPVENYPNDQTRDYESLKRWLYSKPHHDSSSYYGGEGEKKEEKKEENEHPTDVTSSSALETVGETAKNAAAAVQNMAESLTSSSSSAKTGESAVVESTTASASTAAPATGTKPWWKFWSGGKRTRKNKKRNHK